MVSPTVSTASEGKTSPKRSSPKTIVRTYTRAEMLSIAALPQAQRRPSFLSTEFNDEKGLFAPVKWFDNKFAIDASKATGNGRKKPLPQEELGLSPQRRQFAGGCTIGSKEGRLRNGKAAALKDGDSVASTQQKDKDGNKWRTAPERNPRNNRNSTTEEVPEWMESKISINDIIELKGFENKRNRKANGPTEGAVKTPSTTTVASSNPPATSGSILTAPDEDALLKELQRSSSQQNNENSKPVGTTGSRFIGFFRAKEKEAQKSTSSPSASDAASTASGPIPLREVPPPSKLGGLNALFGAADSEKWPEMPVNVGILASDIEKTVSTTDSVESDRHEFLPELTNSIRNPPTVVCGNKGDINGISTLDRWMTPNHTAAPSSDVANMPPPAPAATVLPEQAINRDTFIPTDPKPVLDDSGNSGSSPEVSATNSSIDPWTLFPQPPPMSGPHPPMHDYLNMNSLDELMRTNLSPLAGNEGSERDFPVHEPRLNEPRDDLSPPFPNKNGLPDRFMMPNHMFPLPPGVPPMHPMMMRMPFPPWPGMLPPGMPFPPNQFNRAPIPPQESPSSASQRDSHAFPGGNLPTSVILKKRAQANLEKHRNSPAADSNNHSRRGSSSAPSDGESINAPAAHSSTPGNSGNDWPLPPPRDANGGPPPSYNQEAMFRMAVAQAMMNGMPPPPNMFPGFPPMPPPMMPNGPPPMDSGFPPMPPFFPPMPQMPLPPHQHRMSPGFGETLSDPFQFPPMPRSPPCDRDNASIPESILRSLPTTARPRTLADLEASILSKN